MPYYYHQAKNTFSIISYLGVELQGSGGRYGLYTVGLQQFSKVLAGVTANVSSGYS